MKIQSIELSSEELNALRALEAAYHDDVARKRPVHEWDVRKRDMKRVAGRRLPFDYPLDLAVHGDTLGAVYRFLEANVGGPDEMAQIGLTSEQTATLANLTVGLEVLVEDLEAIEA